MPIHDWTRVTAGIFHDFHHEWTGSIKHALNRGILPEGYYALSEQVAAGLHPDVLTLGRVGPAPRPDGNGTPVHAPGGGVALATAPPRVQFTASAESNRQASKRSRVAVRHSSDDRVVALVEILSPGNKDSRHAIRSFVGKAAE